MHAMGSGKQLVLTVDEVGIVLPQLLQQAGNLPQQGRAANVAYMQSACWSGITRNACTGLPSSLQA